MKIIGPVKLILMTFLLKLGHCYEIWTLSRTLNFLGRKYVFTGLLLGYAAQK